MSGFLDIILIAIVVWGMVCVLSCFNTLNNIRRKRVDKKEIDKVYSYIIITAILYFLFWLIKIQQ